MPYKDPAKRRENDRIRAARYRKQDPERYRAHCRRWRTKNPEKAKASSQQWWQSNKEKARASALARHYKQPKKSYQRRLAAMEAEAGRPRPESCEVCGGTGKISFDHCHQRGIFRGWLCNGCNSILGHAHDDPQRLRMLIAYLERTKGIIPPQLALPGI